MAAAADFFRTGPVCENVGSGCANKAKEHAMPLTLTLLLACMTHAAPAGDLASLTDNFATPSGEFTSGPLWVWNDLLTTEQIETTLEALAAQNVRQVWVHPRPGLMTPYLSEDWFARWEDTLRMAKKLGMLAWIYDENSYPSGFAGGYVPELMPESRGLGMRLETRKRVDLADPAIFAVYKKTADGYEELSREGGEKVEGEFLVARIEETGTSPWFGGKFYVDLLRPGVTEKFLEVTMGAYKARFGDHFGGLVPGVFTDEPHLKPCGEFHWTPDLPEQFKLRWGAELKDGLPHMKDDTAAGRLFRHNYFRTINELFMERWAKPYHDYCAEHNLEFTGHYWEHEWPNCASVPDNMAMSSWQQRPGIDTLFNQYSEGPHAQFGNVRAVIELASVANQTGRARTLCEAYGGSGAEMRFEDYKRIGDWLQVLGVNTLNEHLSDVTLRGARKRDYPPTFSYHSPWMESYHVLVNHFARVSQALSRGGQINHCIVLEPTTTAWMHHFTGTDRLGQIGDGFQALVTRLAKEQLEFDLGSEAVIAQRGSAGKNSDGQAVFTVGERSYTAVVIPAEMENLDRRTLELLKEYLELGGTVFSVAGPDLPSHLDGQPDGACAALRAMAGWQLATPEELTARVNAHCKPGLLVTLDAQNRGIVYHHRRQLPDGDILFITNTSNDVSASGTVAAEAVKGVRVADTDTGDVRTWPFAAADGGVTTHFEIPPCGSLMLFLDKAAVKAAPATAPPRDRVAVAVSEITAHRVDDNNLILDYVDVRAGGESLEGVYWKKAAELTFKQNGLRGNIWDHCVQFGDELLKTEFPADSGFEAVYRFTIEGEVPQHLFAVVERADLYTITCNGTPVSPAPRHWWLDRAFLGMDISACARVGENELVLKASPMTVFHELEAAHLIGNFSLKPAEKGFVVVPAAPLGLGAWTAQGLPLYGHRVSYTATVTVEDPAARHLVALPSWNGVVARVVVNGKDAGHIYRKPEECDITARLNPGVNTVEVIVYGSLRNTLGPHLGNKDAGLTHPGSWNNAPETPQPAGSEYMAVGYGLLAPFEVWRLVP